MSRRILATLIVLLSASLVQAGKGEPPAGEVAGGRPVMSLRLSTYNGLIPFEVELTGGIDEPISPRLKGCWIQVDWDNDTGEGLPFKKREEIPCAGEKAEINVPGAFQKKFVVEKAGSWSYRIILEDDEGKRHASASREVRAIDGRTGFKLVETIGGN